MKVRKSWTPEEVKKRKEILVGDVGQTGDDASATFVKMLPDKDCRCALYDATYEAMRPRRAGGPGSSPGP
ncbi:hypothetical protein QTO34_013141 [Cnephaeus nilssonii]|uniref:Uncharacterized protein n=1 Tax=Cnephaeus nilssonii TaxID=3371016 RepID=A0AA40LUK6_CNENI|nr:hypothetical protein QTO34_013141 [Eptesicus nilssonii]